ncbi:acyl-CoA dehydrogenase [Salinibacter altiplanensis]|uniref:acyl-CoA dehydrogenase n=1 Tax=Salinibacter altiplanensis TaxID=1803181 RepID=UPI0018E4910C|nr:acyl-CoA dehydrogenase [Salinibacter altiplanensis]
MNLPLFEFFVGMPAAGVVGGLLLVLAVLGYTGAPLWAWALVGGAGLYGAGAPLWVWVPYGVLVAVFNVGPIRRQVSAGVMRLMEALQFLPTISETEQTAIDAGTVWMEGELFSGNPDFEKTLDQLYPELTDEEQAFLDGPCEEVCAMVDDWQVHQRGDLSTETWDFLKEKGFFGLIIPEKHGGKGFSVAARSAVVQKLGGHSVPLAITVMVPNSLGPGELLLHYGTDEQQDHYLPQLASGEILPAFALTEPNAGSDAGAMKSTGEVFEDDDGELKLRLNWEKRYISLAAISGVLGLAFKLHDPENHLGKGEDLGITCALVPTDTPGVKLGRRHDPLGVAFFNCPTEGTDVVLPLDAIIGGKEGAGRGWAMLMDALSAGRGIMLPAQAVGGGKFVVRAAGAHAAVREQFGLSIGKFEGIEEPLARIAGYTYIMDAARSYTNGAVDRGEKPGVVSAIMKYNTTELQRDLVNDGMDVLAGNGISRGPNNLMGLAYQALPISITVEGANILTRTMMIFGQGAIRCHPYALKEIEALMEGDTKKFDDAFWSHIGHVVRNGFRALGLSLTRGRLASSPVGGPAAPYYRKMAWASASFAFFADLAMGSLGGMLKRKEKITGRFADILSWMYLGTAVLTRFEKEGRPEEQEPFLHWSLQYAFAQMQEAFEGLFENLTVPGLTWLLRGVVAPWSRLNTIGEMPGDDLGGTLARAIQQKEGARTWLTEDLYVPDDADQPLGELEHAFRLSRDAYHVGQKIKEAVRAGQLPKQRPPQLLEEAVKADVITEQERDLVHRADEARERYIQVDDFGLEEYRQRRMLPGQPADRGALDSAIVEGLERDVTDVEVTPDDGEERPPVSPQGDGAPDRSGSHEPA